MMPAAKVNIEIWGTGLANRVGRINSAQSTLAIVFAFAGRVAGCVRVWCISKRACAVVLLALAPLLAQPLALRCAPPWRARMRSAAVCMRGRQRAQEHVRGTGISPRDETWVRPRSGEGR